ncbi:MAG: acyltransferase [Candidatus Omnitrophica bacterium]|nr:acyltransferase [Candidatus Omnitrophota bacterium]
MLRIPIKEVGIKKSLKYFIGSFLNLIFKFLFISPLRVFFLKILGVKIGPGTVIEDINFINFYRNGFKGLQIGKMCFIGSGTIIDLADKITIEDYVTIAEGVIILTHFNVGYKDHPLQKYYPSYKKPIRIKEGSFVGAGVIILPGVTIGKNTLVAAGAVVNSNIDDYNVVGGVPAKVIKILDKKK